MTEASNGKQEIKDQLNLFPEISEIEGRWLDFPFDWIDLDLSVLRSFAGYVCPVCRRNHLPYSGCSQ